MVDHPRYPNTRDDTGIRRDNQQSPGTPSRTKVLLVVIGIALLALMVGLHLAGVIPQ